MPGYSYIAVDRNGKEKRGSLEADTREKALDSLKNAGMIPISVREQGILNKDIDLSIGKKVKPRDISVFCRQFVSILQAGVPMKEALQMMEEQTENKTLKRSISEVLSGMEKGNTLADSMRAQPESFPPMLVNMVEAGESAGSLDTSFSRMAVHFEKEAKLKATVMKATIYPIILIVVAIAVIAVMLLYVIPIFISMFDGMDIEMPAITMFVMNASRWTSSHWYVLLAIIIALAAGYRAAYKSEQGRLVIDRIKMKMPLFGKLTVKTACAEFSRTVSTLLTAGIPTINCLETAARVVRNIHYTNALMDVREAVMKGIPMSEPLRASGIFPPMVCQMTGIGEETGNLEAMLEKLADYYDEEVEMTTQSVLASMEPLIIVFMALVIGIIVISVISPIAAMYSGLGDL